MNIFFSSEDPYECARNLDNKRVIKMCLESCQMLSTAINIHSGDLIAPYKSTHPNHPSNIWCRETKANWTWLWHHGIALSEEYTLRYGKIHKCSYILKQLLELRSNVPDGPLTPFANCAAHKGLGLDFKHVQPVTEAYRQYLNIRWASDKREPQWSNKRRPSWANF